MNSKTPKWWKEYILENIANINYGTRIVKDAAIGNEYYVYGGGDKTFLTNEYNRENTLVVARFGMSPKCTRFIEGKFFLNDSGLTVETKDKSVLNQEFLNWQLYFLNDYIYSLGKGVAQKNLNVQLFKRSKIFIPKLVSEQREIVKILKTMSKIIQLREKCISHAKELIPSLFIEMFGNPIKNEKKHEQIAIKNLGKVTTGATPPSAKENMFGGTIPFITPGDLETGNYKYNRYLTEDGSKNSRLVRVGSTMVCCIGATIGKVDRAIVGSCFNQQINAVEWNKEIINDIYALYLFRLLAPLIKAKASNTTLPILNKRNFENIFIPKPDIKIQEQFAQKAIEIESYIKEQEEERDNAKQMFQSLLHHAFTGELTRHKFGGDANG